MAAALLAIQTIEDPHLVDRQLPVVKSDGG